MTAFLVVIAFFGLDLAGVIAALAWLDRRRAREDITDQRFRDHRRRYRP